MGRSSAEEAYRWQGDGDFPGHDNYQNGVIQNGTDTTIYSTQWFDGQKSSGYFTDQGTVDKCTHNGVLNANELGEALQTAPSNRSSLNGDYQHKPICKAYDVDWNRLNELKTENPDLHGRLTNPDGLSPQNDGIKCAYGYAQSNPQFGNGGGTQYYIDGNTFNDAVNAGVLKENPAKSFSESKGNLSRQDIPNTADYQRDLADKKNRTSALEAAKGPSTPEQINSFQLSKDDSKAFIAQPDPAYGYQQGMDHAAASPAPQAGQSQSGKGMPNQPHAPPAQGQPEVENRSQTAMPAASNASGAAPDRKDHSSGMPAAAPGAGDGKDAGASKGMPTTASGQNEKAPAVSDGKSQSYGQSM